MRKAGLSLKTVPPGNYSLGGGTSGTYGKQVRRGCWRAVELRILAGQNLSDLTIKLMPPAVISGRVRDEDGDPLDSRVTSVFFALFGWATSGNFRASTMRMLTTRASFAPGTFQPGRYYLSAEPDAFWEQRNRVAPAPQLQTTWYPSSPMPHPRRRCSAFRPGVYRRGVSPEAKQRLSDPGQSVGIAGSAALPGPSQWMTPRLAVSSTPGVGGNNKGGLLKPDGSFEVEGLAPGTWQIRIEQGMLLSQMALGVPTVGN